MGQGESKEYRKGKNKRAKFYFTGEYQLLRMKLCPTQNSFAEALTLSVTVFGGKAFGEVKLKLNEVTKIGR